ncbi:zinc-ribbon domain-containing protein [Corallococcus coralloides]|nr:zinc-ribbon domain-containing protein [Corallococcus coralloides]
MQHQFSAAILATPWQEILGTLPVRVANALRRAGLTTVGDVVSWQAQGAETSNFGRVSRRALRDALERLPVIEVAADEGAVSTPRQDQVIKQALSQRGIVLTLPWAKAMPSMSKATQRFLASANAVTLEDVFRVLTSRDDVQDQASNETSIGPGDELLRSLEALAYVGLPQGVSPVMDGAASIPAHALLESALSALRNEVRLPLEARFYQGLTLEEIGLEGVGKEGQYTREYARQLVLKGLKALRHQWGARMRHALGSLLPEMETAGGLLHVDEVASVAGASPAQVRLMLTIAGPNEVEFRLDDFLVDARVGPFQKTRSRLAKRLQDNALTGVSPEDLSSHFEHAEGLRLTPAVAERLAAKLTPLQALSNGRWVAAAARLPQRVGEFMRLATQPMRLIEIAEKLGIDAAGNDEEESGPSDLDDASVLTAPSDQEEPQPFRVLQSILLRSPEVLLWDKSVYGHQRLLTLTADDVLAVKAWCVRKIENQSGPFSTAALLDEMRKDGLGTGNLNPFNLRSILGRTHGFVGLRKNWVGWAATFKRETLTLAHRFPDIAQDWHPTRNGSLTAGDVFSTSTKKHWWICRKDASHEYEASIGSRTQQGNGCPRCNRGWTVANVRYFVASLIEHLDAFTPAELYLLFQQNGLFDSKARKIFARALSTGRLPRTELEKFSLGQPSSIDTLLAAVGDSEDDSVAAGGEGSRNAVRTAEGGNRELVEPISREDLGELQSEDLPAVETQVVLRALDTRLIVSADEEAVQFLIASGLSKLWKHAFVDEAGAVAQAEQHKGAGYSTEVRDRFLQEYGEAKALTIPSGYAFRVDGRLAPPNLMQRFVAARVRDRRRVGNWSGTGAGKTLSAVLASRIVEARLTVICCPNAVVEGWASAIMAAFPDSVVATKTFVPPWARLAGDETGMAGGAARPRYLVLNYEKLQQPDSDGLIHALIERESIDFVIIDEVHFAKQRNAEEMSLRKQRLAALLSCAAQQNPGLRVLGMSATPVINNLQEGKSLVELITGLQYDELRTQPTVANCMALHQRLVTIGTRWMPEYGLEYREVRAEVDCSAQLDEVRALGTKGSPLALEQILTRARLPVILEHIRPQTVIYTHFIDGIGRELEEAITQAGWSVGFYTGDDKSGLQRFLRREVDVLIGTASIGTGVDGLQFVCNRLIVNVLPWTNAEFEQLKGRIYRQGQGERDVTLVLPLTYAELPGGRWSWCGSKMDRLNFKKSVADAAVDGVVPEGHLRTPEQAYQDVMSWMARLDEGRIAQVERTPIHAPLSPLMPEETSRRSGYGDFSQMNGRWNTAASATTHERLAAHPEEWSQYHALYRAARADWQLTPVEEVIRWCSQRSDYVVGDFGCGEALLARALEGRHTIHSFDHVAIDDRVVATDISHVPLADGVLDLAVFSLSLMGANFTDYLREARRTLKLDGHLHIWEASSRFASLEEFNRGLYRLGFDVIRAEPRWKFTHIHAIKTSRDAVPGTLLQF